MNPATERALSKFEEDGWGPYAQHVRQLIEEEEIQESRIGFWDALGMDEGGLATHLPIGVNREGQGPESDSEAHHYVCWCMDDNCLLTHALELARESGRRSASREYSGWDRS